MTTTPLRHLQRLSECPTLTVAGLMSGTSMDGLDVALCRIGRGGRPLEFLAGRTLPMPADLKAMIEEAQAGSLPAAARADMALGRWFAEATAAFAEETGIAIDLVGSHGQTVCHEHGVTTLQIGEASYIAARLDCPVVADFRRADIAQGGCGAPLVPIFDEIVFGRREEAVLAINIGGIANLTFIPARAHSNAAPTAFDCGPGNMVIDRLASVRSRGARTYDENGAMAAAGRVEDALLERLMEHPFFAGDGPRSAGREQFGHAFTDELIERVAPADDRSWCDLIATATAWTARAIALSIDRADPAGGARIAHVAGGGVHNATLMAALAAERPGIVFRDTASVGIDPDFKEAMAFALLARLYVDGEPGNVPSATGAVAATLLGRLTLP